MPMTSPTDPRAEARALIERAKLSQDGSLFNWFERCDWCGWPLAESVSKGCVADNCSQRPMPKLHDYGKWRQLLRALIAALEAALEQHETLERVDTTARDYIRSCDENLAASKQRRMPDISGEQRAFNALRKALDS